MKNKIIFCVLLIGLGVGINYGRDKIYIKESKIDKINKSLHKSAEFVGDDKKGVSINPELLTLKESSPTNKHEKTPIDALKMKAQAGDAAAQLLLAASYIAGRGVPEDEKQAVEWLLKSAKQGNAEAQQLLGAMYLHGEGVTKDDEIAKEWIKRSALQGNATAQYGLGGIYLDEQNDKQAKVWFQKAAMQGYSISQTTLGEMYAKGRGTPQDYVQADKWFSLAANVGYKRAIEMRAEIELEMSGEQIREAKKLVSEWKKKD